MPISAIYDPEARAMYVRMALGSLARSVEFDDEFVIDLDAEAKPLGLEILALPASREEISTLATQFGFSDQLDRVWFAIQRASPGEPKRTGIVVSYMIEYPAGEARIATGASSASLAMDAHEFALSA